VLIPNSISLVDGSVDRTACGTAHNSLLTFYEDCLSNDHKMRFRFFVLIVGLQVGLVTVTVMVRFTSLCDAAK